MFFKNRNLVSVLTIACFSLTSVFASPAYADDPPAPSATETPAAPTTPRFEFEPLPPLEDIILLSPDFPRLTLQCDGCAMTPYTANTPVTFPTDGMFLNRLATVHLLSLLQFSDTQVRLEVAVATARVRNQDTLVLQALQSQLDFERQSAALRQQELINQRDFALEQSRTRWYEQPEFLIPVGILAGIGLTLATGAIIQETWNPN
tara:strand:- start:615 stop:1229 length:615 start_codon:yes stop_codon:yes gene_type:complete